MGVKGDHANCTIIRYRNVEVAATVSISIVGPPPSPVCIFLFWPAIRPGRLEDDEEGPGRSLKTGQIDRVTAPEKIIKIFPNSLN